MAEAGFVVVSAGFVGNGFTLAPAPVDAAEQSPLLRAAQERHFGILVGSDPAD